MTTRGLYVFKHDSQLGNAHAHRLFARIQPKLKEGVTVHREFTDYDVIPDKKDLPQGVTLMPPLVG
jgi:CRISPR-associated protein Csd2